MTASIAMFALIFVQSHVFAKEVMIPSPRKLHADETAWLQVTVGVIQKGSEIEISTASGHLLGVVSPFGVRSRREAGTYIIPLPRDTVSGGKLTLLVSLTQYGRPKRAPTNDEVKSIGLKIHSSAHSPH